MMIHTMGEHMRFFSKVSIGDGCWNWTSHKNERGYGVFWHQKKLKGAHRASLMIFGQIIPEGMFVDHICRNPSCVNPQHLRAVTPRQNALENSVSTSAKHAAKTHCIHGHPLIEGNIYWDTYHMSPGFPKRVCKTCKDKRDAEQYERKIKAAKVCPDCNKNKILSYSPRCRSCDTARRSRNKDGKLAPISKELI